MADQYWMRVVGFLQPPPARELLSPAGYYRGPVQTPVGARTERPGAVRVLAHRSGNGASAPAIPDEITPGDRLVYFAFGPFVVYAVGTVTDGPEPAPDGVRRIVGVKTEVFINTVMKTPHLGGIALPTGRNLDLLVQQYTYIWLAPEDGQHLVERIQTKAGSKD